MASKRDDSLSPSEMMANARSRASFDIEALTRVIHGDADTVRRRREAWARVEAVLGTSDTLRLPQQYAKTSREDLYIDGLRMGKAAWDDRAKSGHDFFGWMTPRLTLFNNGAFGLSTSKFIKMLELMASPEQKLRWLVPATKGQINGAHMQTELGHGTFMRELETTATFNESRDCFLLNTPTLSSTKFWPGAMGFAAPHGIVMAPLTVKGKEYGVHPFMVQLRDIDTGEAFEGLEFGDIGPKLSHNQNDNGFARLNDVVIPRDSMLSAQASVARDGTNARRANAHEKASYGTIKQGNFTHGEDAPGTEVAIIRYRSQHYHLLTTLAKAYAILFASRHCKAAQRDFDKRGAEGDFSTMQSAHALTAGEEFRCLLYRPHEFEHTASNFQHRAQHLIGKAESRLAQGLKIGETKAQVWNQHIVLLTSAARAHVEYPMLLDFIEATERVEDAAVGKVLCKLRSVFALDDHEPAVHGRPFIRRGRVPLRHSARCRSGYHKQSPSTTSARDDRAH
ncbi:hypothetical protein DL765_001661 [Monosporascus sp. GIB2]|nr:hypothetical protein DL765_001661 [Monosporascus sp. GIB2]